MLHFNKPTFESIANKEWLVTNGIGGYASASISGMNTRRYHGLLVASLNPPTQRQVLVSGIKEGIYQGRDTCIDLSTNQYPGVVHPQGYQYMDSFERSPLPKIIFKINNNQCLAKTIFMVYGSNTAVIEYENIGSSSFQLNLTPFFVDRDYHSLFHESAYQNYFYEQQNNVLKIYSHYKAMPLYFKFTRGNFEEARKWYRQVEYAKEKYRGLDFHEDRYTIGNVGNYLNKGEKVFLIFSTDEKKMELDPVQLKKQAIKHWKKQRGKLKSSDKFFNDLLTVGQQFIVNRASTKSDTILAGYHWFTDWGRDTMIAMRGLTIAVGNKKVSQSILSTFLKSLSEGMLPNRFPDNENDDVEYNTVDATLWLFVALYEYYQKFDDKKFILSNFDSLAVIIEWHIKGTRYNIGLTKEGFLYAGQEKQQLTWMDARVGDYVVTPRHGCPVEIQALWYNALQIFLKFHELLPSDQHTELAQKVKNIIPTFKKNFRKYFLNDQGYLNDFVIPDEMSDDSIRPNQIYVLSLPFSLLKKSEEKQVFENIQEYLYTPYGLRTLNTEHPDFKGVYEGDQWSRDTAYHQGTIWPFLLGDYWLAQMKVFRLTKKLKDSIRKEIQILEAHFYNHDCIYGISEIFDGATPSEGRGTIQQAWSISGLLKVFVDGELL